MERIRLYPLPERIRKDWQSELEGCSEMLQERIREELFKLETPEMQLRFWYRITYYIRYAWRDGDNAKKWFKDNPALNQRLDAIFDFLEMENVSTDPFIRVCN